jgi:predicted helicase
MACEIYYRDIGDYLTRERKLAAIAESKSFLSPKMKLTRLTPNEHGDWITTRNEAFYGFFPLASENKFDVTAQSGYFLLRLRFPPQPRIPNDFRRRFEEVTAANTAC